MAHSAKPYQCAQSSGAPTLHFCPLEAAAIGLHEAIVVARLRFWLGRSKHIFSGRPWVYNTYSEWQKQFPFWSVFTVKNLFQRLEQLGVIESTQRFNTNRWNRTKWYTLNTEALAELVGSGGVPDEVEMVEETAANEAVAMEAAAPIEGQVSASIDGRETAPIDGRETAPIDGRETAPIDGVDFVPCLKTVLNPEKTPKSAGACEPDAGALTPALQDRKPEHPKAEEKAENELDAAYAAIPEAERATWYERADQTLAAAGMPDWMRITPTVKEMALRLWVGATIPGLATG